MNVFEDVVVSTYPCGCLATAVVEAQDTVEEVRRLWAVAQRDRLDVRHCRAGHLPPLRCDARDHGKYTPGA